MVVRLKLPGAFSPSSCTAWPARHPPESTPPRRAVPRVNAATLPNAANAHSLASNSQGLKQQFDTAEATAVEVQGTYDWAKQWYPLAFLEDLDPTIPHPIDLLGQRLVLWRDADQQWRCFQDKCPHRLAPLSEGRIEPSDGTLMCSYHGWRFDREGKCTDIPQSLDAKANAAACSNPRSCAVSHPTQVLQGKVWVYGVGGLHADVDSAAVKPALIDELDPQYPPREAGGGEEYMFTGLPYFRDLPYSWSTLVENLVDPSHLNFSHHGVIGDRNLNQTMKMEPKEPSSTAPSPRDAINMAVTHYDMFTKGRVTEDVQFIAPCFVRWTVPPLGMGTKNGVMAMYAVPLGPGRSRLLWSMIMPPSSIPWPFKMMLSLIPRWHSHLFNLAKVLDGDSALLHAQEKALVQEEQTRPHDLQKLYFMPTQADRLVAAFRKWLAARGGGGPVPLSEDTTLLPKPELLNHYVQHVQHCPSCSKALRVMKALRVTVATLGACMAVSIASNLKSAAPSLIPRPLNIAAGLAILSLTGMWMWLNNTIQRCYYLPYEHSHT